jgi:deoxyribodipyrimidine photo-lyase
MPADRTQSLVWFRRDLRLGDNPALGAALNSGQPVIALFIDHRQGDGEWYHGAASRWYLHHSLLSLQRDLAAIGIPLLCRVGAAALVLSELARERRVSRVYWNRVMEPGLLSRDEAMGRDLARQGIAVERFHDDSLLPPDAATKQDGTPFKVFTPFWRNAQSLLLQTGLQERLQTPPQQDLPALPVDPVQVRGLGLLDPHPWHRKLGRHWQPGEAGARDLLSRFLQSIEHYEAGRDLPSLAATSRLSPALHFGEISVVRVFDTCQTLLVQVTRPQAGNSLQRFLVEIGWREFARHMLNAFPQSPVRSLDSRFETPGIWETDPGDRLLQAWQSGNTGIALVDAGMRELWETGWMHNRVRMVAASLLTKNLGVHWHCGARWFWDTLVDADLASNTLGWQWVAGCGTDAAPYFRVFNPDLQARKFDPESVYIRRWLGDDMRPPPLVDLKLSRARALERYQRVIRRAS